MPPGYSNLILGLLLGSSSTGLVMALLRERAEAAVRRAAEEAASQAAASHPAPALPLWRTPAFRAVFEAIRGGAATLDAQGRFIGANQVLLENLGFLSEELQGRPLVSLLHPEDGIPVRDFFIGLENARDPSAVENRLARELRCYLKDGGQIWAHLNLSLLVDGENKADGEPPVLLALLDDITRRRQAEGAAARMSAGVHDLYQVVADQKADFSAQMHALLSLGCRLFDVETGLLGKLVGERLEIVSVVSPDIRLREGRDCDISFGGATALAGAAEPAGQNGAAPLPEGIAPDWHSHPYFVVTENETFLGAPVYIAGRLYGLLYFSDAEPRAGGFEAEHTQFCQLMALWIGSEIERRERNANRDQEDARLLQAKTRLETIATEDALTGVKNRRAFDERLEIEFQRARRSGQRLSLLLLDVDKFKSYNDTYGHPAGDTVLKRVGHILNESVREGVFVARYGGEEFVVLVSDSSPETAYSIAERLRVNIESAAWPLRPVTASFGAATTHATMTSPDQLVAAADAALYESKETGRNRVTSAPQII